MDLKERLEWETAFLVAQANASLDAILVVDQGGKKILQNQRMVDLFKIPASIALGVDDHDQVRWVTSMIKEPGPFLEKVTYLYSHPAEISRDEIELTDGTMLDRYSAPVVGSDGNYYGRIWTFRDITEQRRVELELKGARIAAVIREGAQRYIFLADSVPLIIWTARPDGGLDYYNKVWFDYTGLTLAQTVDWGWGAVLHPADLAACVDRWTHSVATGEDYEIEYRFKRAADGCYRWFLGRASPHRNEAGEIVQWVGTCTDIDDQKRARAELEQMVSERTADLAKINAELQRQHSELRVLFDLMPAMIWFKDTKNGILRVNRQGADAAGLSVAAIEGRPSGEIYPKDAARFYLDDLEVIRSGVPKLGYVETVRDSSGREAWVQTDKVPYFDPDGKVVGIVVMAQDITTQKRSDDALRASQASMAAAQRIGHFGSWEIDLSTAGEVDANPLQWSDEMYRIAGFEPGAVEASSELFFRLVPPTEHESIRQAVATAIREHQPYLVVHRFVRPSGEVRVVQEAGQIFFEQGTGKPMKIIGTAHDITDRAQADATLRASKNRLRYLIDGMGASMLVGLLTPEGLVLEANSPALAAAGLRAEEVLGKPLEETRFFSYSPEVSRQLRGAITRAAQGEGSRYDMRIRGVGDQFIDIDFALNPVRGESGEVIFLVPSGSVISERKVAETALLESNAKFQQLADNITDAFWIRSPDLSVLHYISPAFERIWGRTVASLYANPQAWSDFILPEDRAKVLGAFAALTGDQESLDIEYRIVRPDGGIRWVHVRGYQVHDAVDQLIRHTGIVTDITERKLAESLTLQSQERYRNLIDHASDAIFTIALDGTFTSLNPAVEVIAGLARADWIGRPFAAMVHPDDLPLAREMFQRVLQGGQVPVHTLRGSPALRRPALMEMTLAALRDGSGRVTGVLGIGRDITERKRLEEQLFHAQKMETVGKLAGGVAHEFSSILTAIIGRSELLLARLPPGDPLAQDAMEIRQAAERAAALTRQLLAYGSKQVLHQEALDLNRLIVGLDGVLRHLLGGNLVELKIVSAIDLQLVKADAGQIEQVIMNIVINAREAMPSGGRITVETANVSLEPESVGGFRDLKPGNFVMIAITDTGTGMEAGVQARIFEPFFTTKEVGQGTGLGLSTCYGIIKQSGGHIGVDSELGRGTTFKIYLPQIEQPKKNYPPPLAMPDLPRGTETVLLVEDDPALRAMAAELLRRLGYTVLAAASGSEALNLKLPPDATHLDLLLTDLVLPHMSGRELADRIVALHPQTKLLFTSAYTENAMVHQGVLAPGVALLLKPFTPTELARKLREVLAQACAPQLELPSD